MTGLDATPAPRRIALLGGTGFVGTALAARLAADGHELRLLTRDPRRADHLRVLPGACVQRADVHDEAVLRRALEGCDTVVNL
ncbi:MAG: NAD-dependent epimerase/dehydratase family protein, partial [Gammaproteobacteria bacterium]